MGYDNLMQNLMLDDETKYLMSIYDPKNYTARVPTYGMGLGSYKIRDVSQVTYTTTGKQDLISINLWNIGVPVITVL